MTYSLIAACLWVLAATGTAMLPLRLQFAPGLALLLAAPPLLYWIGVQNGAWVAVFAGLAVLSMFRRPLGYLARKAVKR